MTNYKLLIDTNIFIGLEDSRLIDIGYANFQRTCLQHKVGLYVHETAVADINRDKDIARRNISLSKLQKFEQISGIHLPPRAEIESKFGRIANENDGVDVALLIALERGATDFLITQDQGIHDRVKLTALARRVLRISDALVWLRQTFEPTEVKLPLVTERKAHEIDPKDDIFDSLRDGYQDFDKWWLEKCVREHRPCWVIEFDSELAGICVRKDEQRSDATVVLPGNKILKLCTFKVKPEFRGEKLGELLLKQALWFAQRNRYELVYVTTQPSQTFLIQILEYYGFRHTISLKNEERVYEKQLSTSKLAAEVGQDAFLADRLNYPRFVSDETIVSAYCVPIRGTYHRKLFPEIALQEALPLFPGHMNFQTRGSDPRTPGNTIRKVYICRSQVRTIKPGDILFFYESMTPSFVASQSITSVGIVEALNSTQDIDELSRLTAKRSVFSEKELQQIAKEKPAPVKVLDFLLVGHFDEPIQLSVLIELGIFNNQPPQSICRLNRSQFRALKAYMKFGFEV